MTEQDLADARLTRDRIDGGFSFALAAFACGLGLLAVLERVGLPDRVIRFCVGALVFSGLVVIAAWLRTMRPADFYAGGRGLPAAYAGLATAGLVCGLFLPFLPPLPPPIGLNSVILGFGAGMFWAVWETGPYLRRSAVFSIADLLGSYFSYPLARYAIAGICAASAALVAIGGYESALRAFMIDTGLSRGVVAALFGFLLVFLIVPGGLSGVIWLAAGGFVVTLTALGLPALLSVLRESTLWGAGLARFDTLTGSPPHSMLQLPVIIALTLGLAALAPLFGPAVASRDRNSALRSGPIAVVFIAIIALLGLQTLARSTLALDAAAVGQAPSKLPAEILAAADQGGVSLCGVQSGATSVVNATCANSDGFKGSLRSQDIGAQAGYLLENLPELRQAGPMLAGLAAVFAITLGMGVAAAGVQSFATSLGHDILHPSRRRFGPTTRRLAVARALAILLIAFCGAALSRRSIDPRASIALALAISAGLISPILLLTLLKRATSLDALVSLAVSGVVMARFAVANFGHWPADRLAATAVFAALDGFLAAAFTSQLHGRSESRPAIPAAGEPLGPD